ncbi:hypothetical protein GLOIN_2v1877636 [Rhizophagus irregularis DAOM 181602=DAOM 197198]|nr:hypothetical protein GLOIN_2v1877636 [Rhizophagus irregularis DAOM 181602=DAOM 197198]
MLPYSTQHPHRTSQLFVSPAISIYNDSHDGNDVDDSGDRAADDEAGAADNGVTNNGRPNDDAANDGIADNDILSSDSYNTEEDGQYVNSLIENYELRKK